MTSWRFYQGLRGEWRWYQLNDAGEITSECDQGFAELPACMANAEAAGFNDHTFHVHARELLEPARNEQRSEDTQSDTTRPIA
jgi:hypothetical protein